MKGEFIICAAIHIDDKMEHLAQPPNVKTGFVVCGRRHSDCYQTIIFLRGDIDDFFKSLGISAADQRKCQGFMTSNNRYVDRREAYKLAKENNQIEYGGEAIENDDDSILISE